MSNVGFKLKCFKIDSDLQNGVSEIVIGWQKSVDSVVFRSTWRHFDAPCVMIERPAGAPVVG